MVLGANETIIIDIIITIVVFIFILLIIKVILLGYKYFDKKQGQKYVNKKLLKVYLTRKYGRKGAGIYRDIKKELWEKHKIK